MNTLKTVYIDEDKDILIIGRPKAGKWSETHRETYYKGLEPSLLKIWLKRKDSGGETT